LRLDTRELSKLGTRIKLQSKPAQVLAILASRPGELVRRDELCSQLWPGGVFVDVESGLNTAMNRLRTVLGDTAEEPFYIETIPRLGYRFICPVQDVSMPLPADEPVETSIDLPSSTFPEKMLLRLAVAIMLALACQFVVFYLDLPGAIAHACFAK
jgi:DNA-binding winged helix-turn-helix (wHTH) protein